MQLRRRDRAAPLLANAQRREYEAIAARIAAAKPDGPVLDWGCGYGQVTDMLTRAGLTVEAFDYDPNGPDAPVTLPRFPHLHAYSSSDPVRLPYPDRMFTAVLSCGVLEHVQDPHGSLEEIRRVLRRGGTFYVYKLPNEFSYLEWVARKNGLDYHGQLEHDRLYTKRIARELLECHGFTVRRIRYANMLPLTVPSRSSPTVSATIWAANRALARMPLLNRLATNVELIASAAP